MKIITYNVNGIRAAITKGLIEWVKEENPDILCLQETKALQSQVDVSLLEELGYHHHWCSAVKKGYSGVATFSKIKPLKTVTGMGIPAYDDEGRVLISYFEEFALINSYFPSGSSGEDRHEFKLQYLYDMQSWIQEFKKENPELILVGDYNIVHTELDIHNPQRKDNPSGYRPEERQWLTDWFDAGFVDAYRLLHPEKKEYSWWSYRAGSRGKNLGWRIDYISVSDTLKDRIKATGHLSEAKHSDHCPVYVEIALS